MSEVENLITEQKRLTDAIAAQQADMGRKQLGRPTPTSATMLLMNLNRQLAAVTMKIRAQKTREAKGA
jgi:hypothetical protein